jgi:hypothetical protein
MDATMQVFKISNTLVCPHPLGLRAWQRATDGALRILLRITRSWRNWKQGREKLEKTSRCLRTVRTQDLRETTHPPPPGILTPGILFILFILIIITQVVFLLHGTLERAHLPGDSRPK